MLQAPGGHFRVTFGIALLIHVLPVLGEFVKLRVVLTEIENFIIRGRCSTNKTKGQWPYIPAAIRALRNKCNILSDFYFISKM